MLVALIGGIGLCRSEFLQESSKPIRRLTPLERAIAQKKDRRRAWDAKKEQEGFKRLTIWVPKDREQDVKEYVRNLAEG